jgi:hypothetical protein
MRHAKLIAGFTIAVCYLAISSLGLGGMNTAVSIIETRENILHQRRCVGCFIIIGGSNSVFGIRSRTITEDIGRPVLNLSLLGEGFNMGNYTKWLSRNDHQPSIVVYSSAKLYDLTTAAPTDNELLRLDGESRASVFFVERLFVKLLSNQALEFDEEGDLKNYTCTTSIIPAEAHPFDEQVAERFLKNIWQLQRIYAPTKILIRIPPAYISAAQRQDWIKYFTSLRHFLQRNNMDGLFLNLMPRLFVSKEKFCDTAFHVKKDFGESLSHELARQIVLHTTSARSP